MDLPVVGLGQKARYGALLKPLSRRDDTLCAYARVRVEVGAVGIHDLKIGLGVEGQCRRFLSILRCFDAVGDLGWELWPRLHRSNASIRCHCPCVVRFGLWGAPVPHSCEIRRELLARRVGVSEWPTRIARSIFRWSSTAAISPARVA